MLDACVESRQTSINPTKGLKISFARAVFVKNFNLKHVHDSTNTLHRAIIHLPYFNTKYRKTKDTTSLKCSPKNASYAHQ